MTKDQFDALELADGRLPNGLPIMAVFHSDEQQYSKFLDELGIDDPVNATPTQALLERVRSVK